MKLFLYTILCITICICFVPYVWSKKLNIGDVAPNFTLVDEDGKSHTLSSLRGNKVALYFYPKDSSPYCTKEACGLRDDFAVLQQNGITIFGISSGSLSSKKKFKAKYQLPFTLLQADSNTLKNYGVRGFLGPKRKTFLINKDGIIVGIIKKVDVNNHAEQIVKGFAAVD